MDWHSSGITTSVLGALKRGLTPLSAELGIHVCGGRGKHSLRTPEELVSVGDRVGVDGAALAQASRLVAKVDGAAVQDGFDLYLHSFIVADDGRWAVPPMTRGNAAAARVRLIVWCLDCRQRIEPDPAEMAQRYGAEMTVPDWRERLVCSRCGSRNLDMVVSGTEPRA
jgi:hypothetical protein